METAPGRGRQQLRISPVRQVGTYLASGSDGRLLIVVGIRVVFGLQRFGTLYFTIQAELLPIKALVFA